MTNTPKEDVPDWWVVPRLDSSAELSLPSPFFNRYNDPDLYDPGSALLAAVNVALLLGQPLLLTGEPGSGKTSLAYWLSKQLGLGKPLVQVVKSTTIGKDLLYSFDELSRFRDAQAAREVVANQEKYVELSALGRAILFSGGADARLSASIASESVRTGPHLAKDLFRGDFPPARRSVVLIDELDKAPSDTPNDLLSEFERMGFEIPELGVEVHGDPAFRPIVVITSNSDKSLPDAFLRRCVYHHIASPDATRRREIVARQKPELVAREDLYRDAMTVFDRVQDGLGRSVRQPGTAELLAWLDVIHAVYPENAHSLNYDVDLFATTLKALVKTEVDLRAVVALLNLDAGKLGLEG